MLARDFFIHYPSRLLWSGMALLALFGIIAMTLLVPVAESPAFPLPPRGGEKPAPAPLQALKLGEEEGAARLEVPSVEQSVSISLDLPRPDQQKGGFFARVRLKGSSTSQIPLPGKLYLCFDNKGKLAVQHTEGPFWMELSLEDEKHVQVRVCFIERGEVREQLFTKVVEETPLHRADEFPVNSPLRALAESRWLGADLIQELSHGKAKQRLEIAGQVMDVDGSDWMVWEEGAWRKAALGSAKQLPIARIRSITPQSLEWEAWDERGLSYVRFSQGQHNLGGGKFKPEECFSAVRIRSEKQMSCMVEKQCFVLRTGDWLLKEAGRWRILRKAEEREQFLSGKRTGDLFILEKIDAKQNSARGKLFFASRVQAVPVDLTAAAIKRDKRHRTGA